MKAPVVAALLLVLPAALCSPILGVPAYLLDDKPTDEATTRTSAAGSADADAAAEDAHEFAHLVVTTAAPAAPDDGPPEDDVVHLDSARERSRFLVTLLMLESLHDKPVADPKLKKMILADEDLMQEVLKLYETTQETTGKHFIKIPTKLMKKMKRKMKELLSDQ